MRLLIFVLLLLIISCSSPVITEDDYNDKPFIISEIMYNGVDSLEFVEIKNVCDVDIPLDGVSIDGGISYVFPNGSRVVAPGDFVLLVNDEEKFSKYYPNIKVDGKYSGLLSNSGDNIIIRSPMGSDIGRVDYNITSPWPVKCSEGYSIVYQSYSDVDKQNIGTMWKISRVKGGTPKSDDNLENYSITINEYAPATSENSGFIELYNNQDKDIDISNWYLSLDVDSSLIYRFKDGDKINKNGYIVADNFDSPLINGNGVVYLFDSEGKIVDSFTYFYVNSGNSYGKISYLDDYFELDRSTKNEENSYPISNSIVITEINYHPQDNDFEYLIIKNIGDDSVVLGDRYYNMDFRWKVVGIDFSFADGVVIDSNESIILTKESNVEVFRDYYALADSIQIYTYNGSLSNNNDELIIQKPIDFYTNSSGSISIIYQNIDKVHYFDSWYKESDGLGKVLKRKNNKYYGNEMGNWEAIDEKFNMLDNQDN